MKTEQKTKNLLRMVFILTIVLSSIAIFRSIFAGKPLNDYYWHCKVGEWIVKNRKIPTYGIYSWYAMDNGLYWFSHEWLSGVLIYLTSFGSKEGALVFTVFLQFLMMLLMTLSTKKHLEKNCLVYLVFHFMCAYVLTKYFYPRPHVYSYFLFFAEMAVLYHVKKKNQESKLVFLIPVIGILWANIHGGSSNIVYILPVFVLLTSVKSFSIGKLECTKLSSQGLKNLLIATLASIPCLCINPHGYKLLTYPLENMQDKIMQAAISEWASPNIKDMDAFVAILPVVLVVIVFFICKKNINAMDLLIFAFFTYMYLRSERFIAFLLISACFYVFDYALELDVASFFKISPIVREALYGAVLVCAFSFLMLSIQKVTLAGGKIPVQDADVSPAAVSVIRAYSPKRMYNFYNLGGELIYNDIDVFIDGRADMYSKYNFQDFLSMTYASMDEKGEWMVKDVIDKYGFDMFVCTYADKTLLYLRQHPDEYTCVYADETVTIYIPRVMA